MFFAPPSSRRGRARSAWPSVSSFVVLLTTLGLPAVALAITMMSAGGYRWDVSDTSGGELIDGTSDAYDGCYYLSVDDAMYRSSGHTLSADGRTQTLSESRVGPLLVQRIVYVPAAGGDWARYLDVLTNPGASEVSARVRIHGNLGSDGATRIFGSSSGDLTVNTDDAWFATDDEDGSGDPSLVHLFQGGPGSGALVSASVVSLSGDNLEWSFDVRVPAGGRIALLTFALQYPNQAAAQAEAMRLLMMPEDAIVGLDEYAADIVNFALASETAPCASVPELGACTTSRGEPGRCRAGSCCAGCWNGTRCVSGRSASACGRGGGMCATCSDADACTSDVCTPEGACAYPFAPRGTSCDDGLFCTASDRCNGAGRCEGLGNRCDDGIACTTDICEETTRSCTSTPPTDQCIVGRSCVARGTGPSGVPCLVCDPTRNPRGWSPAGDGCAIGGVCVARGTRHAVYPCLVCDPTRNAADWSPLDVGERCSEASCTAGRLIPAGVCSASGECVVGAAMRCATGVCGSPTECASSCADVGCPGDSFCGPSGACELRRANGSSCSVSDDCVSGHCVAGICCSEACTETCHSCAVPGSVGRCVQVPPMTDPDGECGAGSYCDESGSCTRGDAGFSMPFADAAPSPGLDAGPGTDAATLPPTTRSGCDCAVGRTRGLGGAGSVPILLLLVSVLVLRARDRARR